MRHTYPRTIFDLLSINGVYQEIRVGEAKTHLASF